MSSSKVKWWIGAALGAASGLSAYWWLSQQAFSPAPRAAASDLTPARVPELPASAEIDADYIFDAGAPAEGDDLPVLLPEELSGSQNILLLGLDRRPGSRYGGLTDTLLVLVLDSGTGKLGVVSVPRDLYVDIPGFGMDRINSAYARANMDKRDGRKVVGSVITDTLGLPIDHTLVVDLTLFETAVDLLGGVRVTLRCPIVDRFLDSRTDTGYRILNLQAGPQVLDGVTAAMFVRSRHGRSDFSRARRQQLVLFGLRQRLLTSSGLRRLPRLWSTLGEHVRTDMTRAELFKLAARLARVSPRDIHGLVLDQRHMEFLRTTDGKAVLSPQPAKIHAALQHLFEAPPLGALRSRAPCPPANVAVKGLAALDLASGVTDAGVPLGPRPAGE